GPGSTTSLSPVRTLIVVTSGGTGRGPSAGAGASWGDGTCRRRGRPMLLGTVTSFVGRGWSECLWQTPSVLNCHMNVAYNPPSSFRRVRVRGCSPPSRVARWATTHLLTYIYAGQKGKAVMPLLYAIQHRGTRELQLNRGVNPPALHCKGGGLAPSSIAIAAWTVEQLPLLLLQLHSFPKPP